MAWSDFTTPADAILLETMGEPIRYRGAKGRAAEEIATVAILDRSVLQQSAEPGYFGTIEVDPAVIDSPEKDDVVVWTDGIEYRVARCSQPAYGLLRLHLVRKDDPVEIEQ